MSYRLQVFLSSACYELRDLRAAVQSWLTGLGLTPLLSDENGFPHYDGLPPYATCLRVLEECPLVIGVIDRQYGHPFDDWGRYEQYRGLSPTHAGFKPSAILSRTSGAASVILSRRYLAESAVCFSRSFRWSYN